MLSVVPSGLETATETVTVTSEIRHLCPFKNEVDQGVVTVTFAADSRTFELHELAAYFRLFAGEKISHEALTDCIFDELTDEGPRVLRVTTEWVTAGMRVVVERS